MKTMLTPMVQNFSKKYKLIIQFKQVNPEPFDTPAESPEETGESIRFEG